MGITEGPFQNITAIWKDPPSSFKAVLTVAAANPIVIVCGSSGQAFTVDWGSGTPTAYTNPTSPVTPTGTVTIESSESSIPFFIIAGSSTELLTTSITGGDKLTGQLSLDGNNSMTSFSIDDGSNVTNLFTALRCVSMTSYSWGGGYGSVTNAKSCFGGAAFSAFGNISMPLCTDASFLFGGCSNCVTIGNIDLPLCTDFERMFEDCTALETIAALDTTSTSGAWPSIFINCTSLVAPNAAIQSLLTSASGYDYN